MNADDTYDLHPAKFQKHCQFPCATKCIAEFADDKFIAAFQGYHQLFPQRTALLVSIVLFDNLHTAILLHPLSVFLQFVIVGGCHDVTYLCHNQYVVGCCNYGRMTLFCYFNCKGMKISWIANHTNHTIILFYKTHC